ncbi:hypothetical protein ACF09C_11955 [Streptomyces sp. NPDC014870]|uniref:hypothetical protein n=1 Tax=Streptomyces sp. NPDC014870 TaxID=3364925 RepID=UPI003700A7CE
MLTETSGASENPGLLTRAADEWPEFVKAAESVLVQSVSFAAWTADTPGGSRIRLTVNAPEGSRRNP